MNFIFISRTFVKAFTRICISFPLWSLVTFRKTFLMNSYYRRKWNLYESKWWLRLERRKAGISRTRTHPKPFSIFFSPTSVYLSLIPRQLSKISWFTIPPSRARNESKSTNPPSILSPSKCTRLESVERPLWKSRNVATVVHPLIHRPTPPWRLDIEDVSIAAPFAPRSLDKFPDNGRPRIAKLNGGGQNGGEGCGGCARGGKGTGPVHSSSIEIPRHKVWQARILGPRASTRPTPSSRVPHLVLIYCQPATLAITHAISCAATSPIQPVNHRYPRKPRIRVESLWIETRHYTWRLTRLVVYGSLPPLRVTRSTGFYENYERRWWRSSRGNRIERMNLPRSKLRSKLEIVILVKHIRDRGKNRIPPSSLYRFSIITEKRSWKIFNWLLIRRKKKRKKKKHSY